jgi:hypothetical protein
MKNFLDTILRLLIAAVVVLIPIFFALFLVEWMAGCGETYIDVFGKEHIHECLFLQLGTAR